MTGKDEMADAVAPPVGSSPVAGVHAPGIVLALCSAAAFGSSGPFVKPLLDSGWSPAAAVAVRAASAGLLLLIPALFALRGRFRMLLVSWRLILAYGLIAVVGAQVFYFAAIGHLPVSVALLIEYLAPTLLVLGSWLRTRVSPPAITLVGTVLSFVGLVLVINPTDLGGIDVVGVLFALGAAVCLAGYFLLSARPTGDLPPIALVASGLLVGAVGVTLVGLVGLIPFTASTSSVALLGASVPWFIPMAVVVVVATAFAYVAGLLAAGRLGSRLASFVGLFEVLFATLLSWLLLGQVPTLLQAAGGALIIAGVVCVRLERGRQA
jgi:drug/metabolite transporter (DMT)-like permease